ncbi:hypothetical protein, partial [Campylobacter sp. RM16191]|uniref:hypothetical protein n=1 Tax=Campylobacter sp. RM16191 TaxID=1705728 RepID=UPI001474E9CA
LRNDFTKENVDKWNAAKQAYEAARKAQEDYTKAVISFTQQIANTQAGFYQSHGVNTSFLAQQATYTKFRTLLSSLNGDISKEEKDSISKFGEFGNIQTWSKYLLSMTARDMQGFMSSGNTELRNDLIATITEYQRQIQANGGKEFWLKSFTDIENIDKQIAALKLAKQTEETLKVQQEKAQREMQMQKEQLSILNLQRAAVEKIGNIAQRIRNQVIDRTTSPINYANALKAAKEAYARGDYRSRA